jgi:hypothetical protein
LYRGDTPVQEIAAIVDCGVTTIYRVIGKRLPASERRRSPLAPAQQAEMVARYQGHPEVPIAVLAHEFGICASEVSRIVRDMGGVLRRPRLGPVQRREITGLYCAGSHTAEEIAAIVGSCRGTVHRVLNEALSSEERRSIVAQRSWKRGRYRFRPDVFVPPLSRDDLWLFGLLMADGTTDGESFVRLGLHARDRDAVESARLVADSEAPIIMHDKSGLTTWGRHYNGVMAEWTIWNREIASRVVALGMVRAKSFRENVQVHERVAESPDFWRGVTTAMERSAGIGAGDGSMRTFRYSAVARCSSSGRHSS